MGGITDLLALTFLAVLSFSSFSTSHPTKSVFLPAPSGKHTIGTIELELIDTLRTDALAPDPSIARSFMVQIFYPSARPKDIHTRAPYMRAAAAAYHEQYYGFPNGSISTIKSNSYSKAPIQLPDDTANIILFSPGFQYSRIFYTSLAEELASQGYVVIAIDHTHDAIAVEFPDGSLALSAFLNITDPPKQVPVEQIPIILDARTKDVNFTLNTLLGSECLTQVPGIKNVKLGKIGMYGHSFGGATAAEVARLDDRILGGLNMDGTFFGTVLTEGLDKPFLVMGAGNHSGTNDPSWGATMWSGFRGWKRNVQIVSAEHMAYSDFPAIIELLGIGSYFPPGHLETVYGAIDGVRAVVIERAYIVAFFDFLLRGKLQGLLDKPSHQYPEVTFPPTL